MSSWFRVVSAVGFLLVATTSFAAGAGSAIDGYVEAEMVRRHIPGASLAVVRDGEILYARGYGFANRENQVPMSDQTPILIASITKTFTGVAVLMLVEEGRVDLELPIGRYVPELPAAWQPATVRQLLQHTSGINSATSHDSPPCDVPPAEGAATPRAFLAEVACLPLDFEPGSQWAYSDTGYTLLGLLIEATSGVEYETFLRQRIFEPLGMSTTYLLGSKGPAEDSGVAIAQGYHWTGSTFEHGPVLEGQIEFASGGLVSTARDLAKWAMALGSDQLLQPSTWSAAWVPAPVGDALYGLGFALRPVAGRRHLGHTGGGPSAATVLAHFPDQATSVIVLTNSNQPPLSMRELAAGLAEISFSLDRAPAQESPDSKPSR